MTIQSLTGKTIAITRSESQAGEFISIVRQRGGTAIALPVIKVVPAGKPTAGEFIDLLRKKKHEYCAFMSAHSVRVLFELADHKTVISALSQTALIAVGPKTLEALNNFGLNAITPREFSSRGLIEMLSSGSPAGKKIIIPRSGEADHYSLKTLTDIGMEVDEIYLYTVVQARPSESWRHFARLLEEKRIDGVIFTSASSVRAFMRILSRLNPMMDRIDKFTLVISIGPKTREELDGLGIKSMESWQHTVQGATECAASLIGSTPTEQADLSETDR